MKGDQLLMFPDLHTPPAPPQVPMSGPESQSPEWYRQRWEKRRSVLAFDGGEDRRLTLRLESRLTGTT